MDTRQRLLEVTAGLLQGSPVDPPSTRAICEAAGVSAPTLYHHFGDKDGLYDAVVAYGFETYVARKHALLRTDDPVADLHRSWDAHVEFGVANPALYTLMYATARAGTPSPAAKEAAAILVELLTRVARTGRLRVGMDQAVATIEAACVGAALQAIRRGYDPAVSEQLRDTVLGSLLTGRARKAPPASVPGAANQLAALLADGRAPEGSLTPEEQALLTQWLRRLS